MCYKFLKIIIFFAVFPTCYASSLKGATGDKYGVCPSINMVRQTQQTHVIKSRCDYLDRKRQPGENRKNSITSTDYSNEKLVKKCQEELLCNPAKTSNCNHYVAYTVIPNIDINDPWMIMSGEFQVNHVENKNADQIKQDVIKQANAYMKDANQINLYPDDERMCIYNIYTNAKGERQGIAAQPCNNLKCQKAKPQMIRYIVESYN